MMPSPTLRRDSALIDVLEAIEPVSFEGPVWRIVQEGRNPLQFSDIAFQRGMVDEFLVRAHRLPRVDQHRFAPYKGT